MASRARIAIGCPSGSEAPHLKLNSAACAGQRRIVGAAAAIVVPTSSVLRDNFIVISSLELESAAGGCLSPRKVPVQRNPCQAALVIFAAKPAWWARSLYMYHTTATEPVGVILAMQTTQEGQMPGLIGEVLLPAFEKHYGFKRTAREIEFFTEHDAADVEHSRRQIELCGRASRHPTARRACRASGARNMRTPLGLDLRALPLGSAGRKGYPTAQHFRAVELGD